MTAAIPATRRMRDLTVEEALALLPTSATPCTITLHPSRRACPSSRPRTARGDELTIMRELPLRPWAPGNRDRYVRIVTSKITGRMIS